MNQRSNLYARLLCVLVSPLFASGELLAEDDAVPPEGARWRSPFTERLPEPPAGGADASQSMWFESSGKQSDLLHPAAFLDPNANPPQPTAPSAAPPPPLEEQQTWYPLPWGPLRQVQFTTTHVGTNDLGFTDLELKSIIAFPTISEDSPLVLTPGYGMHLVDGPQAPDLPPQLQDVYLDVRQLYKMSPTFMLDMAVTPGLYSDFQQRDRDAFRLGARMLGVFTYSPQLQFVVGLAYLDRKDVNFFPLGGVIWTPDDDTRVELISPRPRYAKRFYHWGRCDRWWYVAGEFGGGSWSVQRTTGLHDQANYYDLRLVFGIEQKVKNGPTSFAEAGWVFNRRLVFNSAPDVVYNPGDTYMVRAGWIF